MNRHIRSGKPNLTRHLVAGQPDHEQGHQYSYMQAYDPSTADYKSLLCDTGGNLTVNASLPGSLDVSNVHLPNLSNLDIPLSTLETTLNAIETNTASSADTSNLDIPQSEIKTAVENLDSNVQLTNTLLTDLSNLDVSLSSATSTLNTSITGINSNVVTTNTLLGDLANLDVPISSATSTLNTSITGVNSNVVTLSDKFRTGAEQSLDPADSSNLLVQTLIYGYHQGHGSGVNDQHPISVNANGHLFATVETDGTPLDVVNANVDIPLSSGVNALNTTLEGINSNLNSQSSLLVDVSNINVPLSDIATLIDNSNVTNITGLGAVATAVNNVDTATQNVDSNVQVVAQQLALLNAPQSSVYSNSITQIGAILVPSPCKVYTLNLGTASANQTVLGLYNKSAIAPTEADTPLHVVCCDNTTTSITLNFGPGGLGPFTSGLAVRAQTTSGSFDIFSNGSVATNAVACSITYVPV